MVKSCAAYACSNRLGAVNEDGSKVNFHRLPADPERLKKWIHAMKRKDLTVEKVVKGSSYLCSQHFIEDDYTQNEKKRVLKEDAIPSIFAFPEYMRVKHQKRKPSERVAASSSKPEPAQLLADHTYHGAEKSTSDLEKREEVLVQKLKGVRKERKLLRQKVQRRDARLKNLHATIAALKESNLVSGDMMAVLQARFENPVVASLFQNEVVNASRKKQGRRYSDEIRRFCLTINYYSPRAYNFLAKNFALPSKSSMKDWTRSVDCNVGILTEVTSKLKELVKAGKIDPNCSLMVDEMSIRKAAVYSHTEDKFVGHVDLGAGDIEDGTLATSALMFMAVGLKGQWRHPVAYYLMNHASSETLAELSKSVLCELAEAGLTVRVMVADGLKANLTMFANLGASVDFKKLKPGGKVKNFFSHPSTGERVYILLDVVHMIKLLRNLLGEYHTILLDGETISWKHIQALYDLQHEEGIRAGNKLSRKHVEYNQNKMKVKLAVQVFSSSVGKALHFLADAEHPGFEEAGPTAKFLLTVDRAFDFMNGSSPFGKGYKAPLTPQNLEFRRAVLDEFAAMLQRLTTVDGRPLLQTKRYTAILGLVLASQTTIDVGELLLQEAGFSFVLPYRMSQDHLELHFGRIRRMGGLNNNPNAAQLRQAMRKLILHNFITPSFSGNCCARDEEDDGLLTWRRPKSRRGVTPEADSGMPAVVQHVLGQTVPSDFLQNCTAYVAGYVCRKLVEEKRVRCAECIEAIQANDRDPPPAELIELIKVRDNGGLIVPSRSALKIILSAERHLKAFRKCMDVTRIANLCLRIQVAVLREVTLDSAERLFPQSQDHMFAILEDEGHFTQLVKLLVGRYITVRLYDFGKTVTNEAVRSVHARHRLTKTIIFGNQ